MDTSILFIFIYFILSFYHFITIKKTLKFEVKHFEERDYFSIFCNILKKLFYYLKVYINFL